MNWLSKFGLTGKKAASEESAQPSEHAVFLDAVGSHMFAPLPEMERSTADLPLLRARIADLARDQNLDPVDPDLALKKLESVDEDSQKRMSLVIHGMDDQTLRKAFFLRCAGRTSVEIIDSLLAFATKHRLLAVPLLIESPLRREEFVRQVIHGFGLGVINETEEDSRQRLERLDYGQLMAAAEKAKLSALERTAYLRKLQDEQEKRLGRRSKI